MQRNLFKTAKATMPALLCWLCCLCCFCCLLSSCSEEKEEESEYDNWQARNDAYFAALEKQYTAATDGSWLKLKSYAKNPSTAVGKNTDCIYAQVLESGTETESPLFNDSVRVSYEGRLIPTSSHPEGLVFDATNYGDYDAKTNATIKFAIPSVVTGFATALQHMHRGDTWRIYVPYSLGYGSTASSGIPAYSTLIFKITLIDFQQPGHAMQPYSSRQAR